MSLPRSVVVVGGSLAGIRCVETLRRRGYEGRITLVGREVHLPYDRPPLSKDVLRGERSALDCSLTTGKRLEELDVLLRLGMSASGLDTERQVVVLENDEEIAYDALVIASGAEPCRLPHLGDLSGVHYLRTADDAEILSRELASAQSVAVVGGGFIGGEVASSARSRGLPVAVIEGAVAPLALVLGRQVGAAVARLYTANGVDLRCEVMATGLLGDEKVTGVVLSDEGQVAADVVIVGIGVTPCVDWLASSGLTVEDGVVCDEFCRVVGQRNIFAAGDVARWEHPLYGSIRVEHWTNAVEQATAVAENLLAGGEASPYAPIPYFWSDQFGTKIQFVGRAQHGDVFEVVDGDIETDQFAATFSRDGRVVACIGFNRAKTVTRFRREIGELAQEALLVR